jgi:hypothetical protein
MIFTDPLGMLLCFGVAIAVCALAAWPRKGEDR